MHMPGIHHRSELRDPTMDARSLRRAGYRHLSGPWFASEDADPRVSAILRIGARPTCLDAAAMHGLWIPDHPAVHVRMPRLGPHSPRRPSLRASPLRLSALEDPTRLDDGQLDGLPLVRRTREMAPQPFVLRAPVHRAWKHDEAVMPLADALLDACRCLPVHKAAILLESALEKRCISRPQVEEVLAALPVDISRQLSRVRSDAGSGTETRVRWWLESLHVHVRAQVLVLPWARVDMLVGKNWVIECDSHRFHELASQYSLDRERDLALRAQGFTVTRLTYEQVFRDWERTSASLLQILRRREHRRSLPR